jgi:hypothetical protein
MKGKFEAKDLTNLHKQGSPMIIFIYSPGCGHCTKYEPEWNKHYEKFPHYSINHDDTKTPSIGSISLEELYHVPIQVRSGSTTRQLSDFVDFVPKMVSLDREGHVHPISNIRNFDGIREILNNMDVNMSGGYLHTHMTSTLSKSTTRTISKKRKTKKTKKKKKKKKKKKGSTRNTKTKTKT